MHLHLLIQVQSKYNRPIMWQQHNHADHADKSQELQVMFSQTVYWYVKKTLYAVVSTAALHQEGLNLVADLSLPVLFFCAYIGFLLAKVNLPVDLK